MAATTPGVLNGQTTDIGLSFRGAGQREIQNSLTMDGINATSNLLAMTSTRPMADAVTEVTVQTGSTSAEYGSYLGVAINVVTKSGTNGFHGALFEYFQGDKLESRGYFDNRNLPESPKKSNQFGVQFDGPVMIPGLYDGKNKTFFMGAYEGLRSNRQTSPFASVPTAKMRAGDFSEVSTQIRNPYTKVPYPGNIIPRSDIAAQALELLQYYPQPNLPGLANNYQTDVLTTNENDQLLLRVDQNIGQSARVYGRYNWVDAFDGFGAAVPSTATYQPRTNKNTLLSYQQTISPTLLNDFRIGWHRLDLDTVNNFDVDGNGTASSDLGIPGFDADVRYDNFGIPTRVGHGVHGPRRRRHQLVSVRHDVPGLQRAVLDQGHAQPASRHRPAQAAHRSPCRQQPARGLRVHQRHDGARGGRLPDWRAALRWGRRSTRFRATSASGATASSSTTSGRRRSA